MIELPSPVRQLALQLAGEQNCLPAYVYDLAGLAEHVRRIRMALPAEVELFYAAKANSEIEVLDVLAGLVDGFEVSSGGELQHCYQVAPGKKLAFGGPGKRREELELALRLGVDRLHVESLHELRMLVALTGTIAADILLRINLSGAVSGAVLAMGGGPTPFGLDEGGLEAALDILAVSPQLRLRGLHAHLASGLQAPALLRVASRVVEFARKWSGGHGIQLEEINLGGGMGIDYEDPQSCFDWITFGDGLKQLIRPGEQLRIEPGRAVTAYHGWYLTQVLDLKRNHGELFAVVHGGTHHLRTPAAKGHSQPFVIVPIEAWPWPWPRPQLSIPEAITVVGQLCTPKDVLARRVQVSRLQAGDVLAFAMAGAYAWNISHHDFLMHPPPGFRYIQLSKERISRGSHYHR